MKISKILVFIINFCLLVPVMMAQDVLPPIDTINKVTVQLLEDVPVEQFGETIAVISPDGTQVVSVNTEDIPQLCLHNLVIETIQCSTLPEDAINVDGNSVRWSSDQQYIAFTTYSWEISYDGDIWLFDTSQLIITNITEDTVDGRVNIETDNLPVFFLDIAPYFAPDGRLMFIRYQYIPEQRTYAQAELMVFTTEMSVLEAVFSFPNTGETEDPLTWHMVVSPDGTLMAWLYANLLGSGGLDADAGIYLTDTQTFSTPQQLATYQDYMSLPIGLEFSPNSQYLLTLASVPDTSSFDVSNSSARVLDIETGDEILISENYAVHHAGWMPSGSGLVYTVLDTETSVNSGLYISNTPGEPGHLLHFDNTENRGIDLLHLGRVRTVQEFGFTRRAIEWGTTNRSLFLHPSLDNLLLVTYGE